jgi:glycosyltransferase involved in cell wall biosynthesis
VTEEIRTSIRAVHLAGSVDPAAGGPAYSIPGLCAALRTAGVHVDLLTLKDPRGGAIAAPRHEFDVQGPWKLGRAPDMERWLNHKAAKGQVDVTHSHVLWQMPSLYPDAARRRWGVPHVVSPRGTLTAYSMSVGSRLKAAWWPLIQRPAMRRASLFHVTAESEIEDLRRLGLRQPAAFLPIGLDLPAWRDPPTDDPKVIVFLGRLHPEKGPMDLIEAWDRIHERRPDWRLRLVGPDQDGHRAELEARIAATAIPRVEFAGSAWGDGKFEALREASICVLPSPTENFGVTVAEALAVGTPVIANHGAPWAALEAEKAGWWIPNGVDALTDALMTATDTDAGTRRRMGRAGRDYVGRTLGWPSIGARMAESYAWILGRGSRPACVHVD